MKFSLRLNQKTLTTSGSSDRNLQFDYIADLRERFQHGRMPIISVDSKKRELVGNFKRYNLTAPQGHRQSAGNASVLPDDTVVPGASIGGRERAQRSRQRSN